LGDLSERVRSHTGEHAQAGMKRVY
jgi:hypothetical protein